MQGLAAQYPALFLHFMDSYHFKFATRVKGYPLATVRAEIRTAFRVAYLLADVLYLSASAYVENPVTRQVVREHRRLVDRGELWLVGSEASLEEHNATKLETHYRGTNERELFEAYGRRITQQVPYRQQAVEVSAEIRRLWDKQLHDGALVKHFLGSHTWKALETTWVNVPDMLEGRALVAPHILDVFARERQPLPRAQSMYQIVDAGYAISHAAPLNAAVLADPVFLGLSDELLFGTVPAHSYRQTVRRIEELCGLTFLKSASVAELVDFRESGQLHRLTGALTRGALDTAGIEADILVQGSELVEVTRPAEGIHVYNYGSMNLMTGDKNHMGDKYEIHHLKKSQLNIKSKNSSFVLQSKKDALAALDKLIESEEKGESESLPLELFETRRALESGDTGKARTLWQKVKDAISVGDTVVKTGTEAMDLVDTISKYFG